MGKTFIVIIFSILALFASISDAKAAISFVISNPVVNSDDEIEIDATISGLISSSCSMGGCYLQAEFQSSGGYFGYTYNNSGEFVDYFKTPSSVDDIKTKLFNFIPVGGAWSGKLKAKNNRINPFYYGPGQYPLTFRRFSGNSTTPTSGDSNPLLISLKAELPAPTPGQIDTTPTSSPTPTLIVLKTPEPTSAPTPQPSQLPGKTPSPKPKMTATPVVLGDDVQATAESNLSDLISSLITSPIPTPPAEGSGFPVAGALFVASGIVIMGVAGFMAFKKQKSASSDTISE